MLNASILIDFLFLKFSYIINLLLQETYQNWFFMCQKVFIEKFYLQYFYISTIMV